MEWTDILAELVAGFSMKSEDTWQRWWSTFISPEWIRVGHGKWKTKQRPTRKSSINTIQLIYIIALFQCFFSMRTTWHCPTGQSTLFQVHCPVFINKNVRVGPRDLESFCVSQQQEDKAAACPFIHGKLWNYIFVLSLASLSISPFFMDYRFFS